jgi:hypothetical protein
LVGQKGALPDVFWFNLQIMVAIANVKLCEQVTASELVNQLRYEWEWIMILDSPLVKLAVVVDRSEFSAFLFDEEERCYIWAL